MKIAIIGAGQVGGALAVRLARGGHEVVLAGSSQGSESVKKTLAREASLRALPLREAVAASEVVFLATPYAANAGVVAELGEALDGKLLVDCTNPVGPGLSHGLKSETSGSAKLQESAPRAKFVKAFTIYGFENFEDSAYPGYGVKPAMLYCGNDGDAKASVGALIAELGFEPVDVGGLEQALHLEHMTLLWVRMVRAKGHSPNLVWAALRR